MQIDAQLHFPDPRTVEDMSLTEKRLQAEMLELEGQPKAASAGPVAISAEEQEEVIGEDRKICTT